MKLNPQQQAAVKYLGGPLLVLAGAGSGKTGVITQKIKHLIVNVGYLPHTVAAITFTNKAATEMQERVSKMLPKSQTRGLTICTFHSLGMKILREEANQIGYKKNFSILDSTDSAKIIGELLGGTGKEAIFKAQHQISLWKNDLKTPEEVVQTASNVWEEQTARVYASYQETLQSYQAVDFDDLIRLPAVLLQQNSEVRNKWQRRLRYLLVDECQDTNTCQFTLMKLLTGAEGMFTAVGDDDQSIYAWRGANMENLRKMQEDYPQMKVIKLEQNYRSTARILKIANKVIETTPNSLPKNFGRSSAKAKLSKSLPAKASNMKPTGSSAKSSSKSWSAAIKPNTPISLCYTAATIRRGFLKKPCAARAFPTNSPADKAFSTKPKSKMCCPICACLPIPTTILPSCAP